MRYTRAQYPWVTGIFIWNLNFAVITSAQDEKSTFAILGADWSPRPAYIALQAYVRQQAADLQLALPRPSAAAPYQAKWSVFTTGKVHTPPSIGPDGTVYIGSDQGRFSAITPGGGVRWVFAAPGGTRVAPAFGDDGSIYVGDDSGHLTALRPDGSVRWQQALSGPIHGTPQLAQDGLYLTTGSEAARLDFNGNLRWHMALAGPAKSASMICLRISPSPACELDMPPLASTKPAVPFFLRCSVRNTWRHITCPQFRHNCKLSCPRSRQVEMRES